jgi:hypothetical protein
MYHFKVIQQNTKCDLCGNNVEIYTSLAWKNMVTHQLNICKKCLKKTVKEMEKIENEITKNNRSQGCSDKRL